MSLHLDKLCFSYTDTPVFKNFSLVLEPGVHALVGSNGTGKSTLFKLLSGLLPLEGGAMSLGENKLSEHASWERAQWVGMSFQDPSHQFFLDSVEREFWQQCLLSGDVSPTLIEKQVEEVSRLLKLEQSLEHDPFALRFGHAQRVAWGIALLGSQRTLYLLDEPTARMDQEQFEVLQSIVAWVRQKPEAILVFITHDMDFVEKVCDSVLWLAEGRVCYQGPCSDFLWSEETPYTSRRTQALKHHGVEKPV